MKKYVVTYANLPAWKSWGASWAASLKQFANFDGQAIVLFRGKEQLPKRIVDKLAQVNINIIPVSENTKDPMDFVSSLCNVIHELDEEGVYVYWGVDSYFENSINEIFDEAANKMVCCQFRHLCHSALVSESSPLSTNMIGGTIFSWEMLHHFSKCFYDFNQEGNYLEEFSKNFPKLVESKDDVVWNCGLPSAVKLIQNKLVKASGTHVRVREHIKVFCPGAFQTLSALHGLQFYQRHPSVTARWHKWLYGQPSYKRVFFNVSNPLPLWGDMLPEKKEPLSDVMSSEDVT